MNRSKFVAIITGAISIIIAIAYLIIVQLLDFRGEMLPAPQSLLPYSPVVVTQVLPKNCNISITSTLALISQANKLF